MHNTHGVRVFVTLRGHISVREYEFHEPRDMHNIYATGTGPHRHCVLFNSMSSLMLM